MLELGPLKPNPSIDDILRWFVRSSGISLKELAAGLEISAKDCLLWWNGVGKVPSFKSFDHFFSRYGLDLECLYAGELSPQLLRKRILGEPVLPERY